MQTTFKKSAWTTVQGYMFMLLGCLAYGFSIVLFLKPCSIVAGGVSGLATLFHLLNNKIPIGVMTVTISLPIFLFGLKYCGWKFILKSLLTISVLSAVADIFAFVPSLTDNPLLAALYGGIFQGVGIGCFVKYRFSSGGTELLGRLMKRWFRAGSIPVWTGVCDALIVLAGAICLKSTDNVLYALIVVFVSTKVSEIILLGLEKSKMCIIISDKGEEISQELLQRSPRGITMLDGKGMYTKNNHDVLITCVKNRQLTQLQEIVRQVDEHAFVIVNEAFEVRGQGFKDWGKED